MQQGLQLGQGGPWIPGPVGSGTHSDAVAWCSWRTFSGLVLVGKLECALRGQTGARAIASGCYLHGCAPVRRPAQYMDAGDTSYLRCW